MISGDEELGFISPTGDQDLCGDISKSTGSEKLYHSGAADASIGYYASIIHGGFPDEPSLFEEMGIHNTNIKENLKIILLPMSKVQVIADNNFLVGLLFFCLFAGTLLLLGKVRFGMVYMIGMSGFTLLYFLFKFMTVNTPESLGSSLFTALSYCTIPLAMYITIIGITRISSPIAKITMGIPFIVWAGFSATRYILPVLNLNDAKALIFFPIFIFYSYLLLLPIS